MKNMKNMIIAIALIATASIADSSDKEFKEYPEGCKAQYEFYLSTNNFDSLFSCYSALKTDNKKITMVPYSK